MLSSFYRGESISLLRLVLIPRDLHAGLLRAEGKQNLYGLHASTQVGIYSVIKAFHGLCKVLKLLNFNFNNSGCRLIETPCRDSHNEQWIFSCKWKGVHSAGYRLVFSKGAIFHLSEDLNFFKKNCLQLCSIGVLIINKLALECHLHIVSFMPQPGLFFVIGFILFISAIHAHVFKITFYQEENNGSLSCPSHPHAHSPDASTFNVFQVFLLVPSTLPDNVLLLLFPDLSTVDIIYRLRC